MDRISSRCARTAARALCCTMMIAVATAGCEDAAPSSGEPAADAGMTAPFVPAPDVMPPSADPLVAVPGDAAVAVPGDPAVNPVAARDAVDADGVRGALVDMPFLADMGDGKKNLILLDWEVPPNRELYLCGRVTVPDDLYISANYPVAPVGTHHTQVSVLEKPNAPDGVRPCDLTEIGRRSLGGSGVGTGGGKLPQGMAMKAERGNQLILNLHLYNVTDAPLRGRSGALVETVLASQVTTLADGVAAGSTKLRVPPGLSVQTGTCTVDYDYTVFRVFPHMHETGRHMKVVAKRASGDVVLHDGAYDFSHQLTYPIEPPLKLTAGDRIETACTFDNATGQELTFGESSKDEMCIAGLVRFPAGQNTACPF